MHKPFKATDWQSMISQETLNRLSTLRPLALWSRILFDYTLIFVIAIFSEIYSHPALYIIAIMAIGARQAGIGTVALHDGVHGRLSKNKRLNDFFGRAMSISISLPILVNYDAYRNSHFSHHKNVNTSDDQDVPYFDSFYKRSPKSGMLYFLIRLTGAIFAIALFNYIMACFRSKQSAKGLIVFTIYFGLIVGFFIGYYPAVLIVKYWIIPMATWGIFINEIRTTSEHYPENTFQRDENYPALFRSRDVINSWFDSLFITTRGVNYHLSHHLFPQVPFYNLPKLHAELLNSPLFKQYTHVTYGFHRYLAECLFQRSQSVGLIK